MLKVGSCQIIKPLLIRCVKGRVSGNTLITDHSCKSLGPLHQQFCLWIGESLDQALMPGYQICITHDTVNMHSKIHSVELTSTVQCLFMSNWTQLYIERVNSTL